MSHYAVLGLSDPPHSQELSQSDIRRAYHRALLENHPDKTGSASASCRVSVHRIRQAYHTLSVPTKRVDYDIQLQNNNGLLRTEPRSPMHFAEILDLSDLDYIEIPEPIAFDIIGTNPSQQDSPHGWFHPCRCGVHGGFWVTEDTLELQQQDNNDNDTTTPQLGEAYIQCIGCSAWIKVQYAVVNEE